MAPINLRSLLQACQKPASAFKWRWIDNLAPSLAYQFSRKPLSGEAALVLTELNRNGIAITSVHALLGRDLCYSELKATVERLERDLADHINTARSAANDPKTEKTFNFSLVVGRRVITPDDIFVRFALHKPILQIANAYFGMYARLRYCNVWHTFATQVSARDSQLWHYDHEDRRILKVFVYLSDVDGGAGPFTYAAGSHSKGKVRQEPAFTRERGKGPKRSNDSQMVKVVPAERWVEGVGPEGTIIFADTRGYHRGGLARERDRIMYHCMFTSSASHKEANQFIERSSSTSLPLDKEQSFALSS